MPAVLKGDGLMTDEPGVLLGIQTADCIPVLIADRKQRAVAAFHAGWRGTLARIVENGVGRMRLEFGSRPQDLIASIGPGIGQCCYAVGEEVRQQFESQFDYASELFREVYDADPVRQKYPMLFLTARAPGHSDIGPSMHLDLAEANRRQLLAAGLRKGAIFLTGQCTGCHTDRFFSHRTERGFTGRMMSVIGVAQSLSRGVSFSVACAGLGCVVLGIDQIAQFLAGLKVGHSLRGHIDLGPRLRVPSRTGLALSNAKTAKTADFDLVTGTQCVNHGIENGIHDHFPIPARQVAQLGYFLNEVCFGHGPAFSKV